MPISQHVLKNFILHLLSKQTNKQIENRKMCITMPTFVLSRALLTYELADIKSSHQTVA